MGFLSSKGSAVRYGVIIDVGSGSVLMAIIKSDPAKAHPEIIWAKREYAPLRNSASLTDSAKNVMTSLVNVILAFESEGRKALEEVSGYKKLTEIQVTIAAPWSYTVTKNISYSHSEAFSLSAELIAELLRTSSQQVEKDIVENEQANKLGLSVVARSTIGLLANGYAILNTNNQTAKTLRVVEATAVAQDYMIKALNEACNKVLPGSILRLNSFILIYFFIVKSLYHETQEFCLVDITYEATELGVVRDGVLNYTTHTPFGSFSLARELAAILNVPLGEAFGYLQTADPLNLLSGKPAETLAEVKTLFTAYQKRLVDLFKETGDALSIPKKVYLHGDLQTEDFFSKQINEAAQIATNTSHAIYPVSKELLTKNYPAEMSKDLINGTMDSALLISAQFFHMRDLQAEIEHF